MESLIQEYPTNTSFEYKNWAQTVSQKPHHFHEPRCTEDIVSIVTTCLALQQQTGKRQLIKPVGVGHSPNDICVHLQPDATLHMVSLQTHMTSITFNPSEPLMITIQGGVTIRQLLDFIDEHNKTAQVPLSVPNLPSITDLTWAGLFATSTHGTGIKNPILAKQMVREVTFVDGTGKLRVASSKQDDDTFKSIICSLGCLGIITELKMEMLPQYNVECHERLLPFTEVLANYTTFLTQNDFFRFWWIPHTKHCVVWTANRTQKPLQPAPTPLHPFYSVTLYHSLLVKALANPQLLKLVNRLFSLLLFSKPKHYIETPEKAMTFNCLFPQHTMEYAIPVQHTKEAMLQIREMIERKGYCVNFPLEVRFTGKDDILASSCEGWDACWIGVVMYRPGLVDPPHYKGVFKDFQEIMDKFQGRPHWAKAFDQDTFSFKALFPRTSERFLAIRQQLDPHNLFENSFISKVLRQ
ncbi:hypothetical protein FGO68_gene10845 [Halteria grandinella]|uniref:FAD-binding PCMH-type domain-containing protein n=1 Tax=Halteria grandinella TaxID=5974 RepID=A0A8J8NP46_HALGN|nr:hypothetical protein FGO68_gene10845 [Halteria grandinella]